MNFADFYSKANQRLIEALGNMWFKGKSKARKHFEEVVSDREPLISEPVFQTIFPWLTSPYSFMEHATQLNILNKEFVDALNSISLQDYRFPADRHPYTHQSDSWKAMLDSNHKKTIVVTSGTGSGKTECFMIPVLQDLYNNRGKGVQAIFLYPLNALMSDQQKRIHEWCKALNIRYAIYNGDTISSDPGRDKRDDNYPRLLSREEIRKDPPQILFTNPTMLNYILVRGSDSDILETSKKSNSLRWILLDEAHTYTGSAATELALQIRRVIDAFGNLENVNFAVTSATIGDSNAESIVKLKRMVSNLTGKDISDIEVIGGERTIPAMNRSVVKDRLAKINSEFSCSITEEYLIDLRHRLNKKPLKLYEVTNGILPQEATKEEKLQLIDALAEKVPGLISAGHEDALLPARAHFMIRSINGIYTCSNPNCPDKSESAPEIGHFTTHMSTICPHPDCHAPMLEIVRCASCGELLIVGSTSDNKYSTRLNSIRFEGELFDSQDENDEEDAIDGVDEGLFIFGKGADSCPRSNVVLEHWKFNPDKGIIETGYGPDSFDEVLKDKKKVCPHCGETLKGKDLQSFCAGAQYLGQVLASLILDQAAPSESSSTIHKGQKYITFTDSRQSTAKSALLINQEVERDWIRTQLYQNLAKRRMEHYSPGGLTEEEKEELEDYKKIANPNPRTQRKIKELEAKQKGEFTPDIKPVAWNSIKQDLLTDPNFKKLFQHIAEARRTKGIASEEGYLNALFINQMGRAPRHANSLETLGLVKIVYPQIDCINRAPDIANEAKFSIEEWKAFLYICLNYFVRENFHYEIPIGSEDYCVQEAFTDPIFGPDATLESLSNKDKKIKKWPTVKKNKSGLPNEEQQRLVLILCAALGYNKTEDLNVELVDSLLRKAWEQIESTLTKVENSDIQPCNHGYKLCLTDESKVRLSLISEGWICPVENTIVTDNLRGFSPRMKGFVNKDNFSRYRIEDHLAFPFFPYPENQKRVYEDNNISSIEVSKDELNAWIDTEWESCIRKGQFSDIVRDILNIRQIFITAEHSAQLSQAEREKSVKLFKEGLLNILACSTTMEMGVDISGISEVVMNTVPPKPANYLQRAGRAGRRGESKAMAITFCSSTPIGNESWNNPDWPMTHSTELPAVKMDSRQIVQRHINSLLFSIHVRNIGGMNVKESLEAFFEKGGLEQFNDYLAKLLAQAENNLYAQASSAYASLIKGTILAQQEFQDGIANTRHEIKRVYSIYREQVDAIKDVLSRLEPRDSAYKANDRKLARIKSKNLLVFLSENAFLPSAGMPIGLVEFVNDYNKEFGRADNEEGLFRKNVFPTKHISQAITEYAPGNQVVINEWCYKSAGVGLKSPFSETNQSVIQQCSHCKYTTVTTGDFLRECPECGQKGTMRGVLLGSLYTEIIEPVSFNVDYNVRSSRKLKKEFAGFANPKMLNMSPWPDKFQGAKYIVRSSADSDKDRHPEILFFNRGANDKGYAYCPYCGRMESEKTGPMERTGNGSDNPLKGHYRLDGRNLCESATLGHIRRNVILSGRYQTDFVEIKFFNDQDKVVTDKTTLYSLGVIITRKLSEMLGINDGEIGFGLNSDYNSIFIYDTAIGGAGYSILFRTYSSAVFDAALLDLKGCNCEKSCTSCLIDRRTQWSLDLLDRNLAIKWLEMEKNSRTAPQVIADAFGPSVRALTCDMASEVCSLFNSGNLNKIHFCLSTDVSGWNSSFRYLPLMEELKRGGCDVSFLLSDTLNLDTLQPSQLGATIASLFKADFNVGTIDCGSLKPVLFVELSQKQKFLYFGEDPDLTFSDTWGIGRIYCAEYNNPVNIAPLDRIKLLVDLQSRKFVKHFYIKTKKIYSNDLLDTIISNEGSSDWGKVYSKFSGKTVKIKYTDKHLNSPLAVFLLKTVISQLRDKYSMKIANLTLHLSNSRDFSSPEANELSRFFASTFEQEEFINSCFGVIGITPTIDRSKIYQHERDIIISDNINELSILPNGGISWGWRIDHANQEYETVEDLLKEDSNPLLYNSVYYRGITYTIVLSDD